MGRNLIEIFRPWRAWSKRLPDLVFIDDKAVGELVCRHTNTSLELRKMMMKHTVKTLDLRVPFKS